MKILEKRACALRGARHLPFERHLREIAIAEQPGFLVPQLQHFRHDGRVVPLRGAVRVCRAELRRPRRARPIHFLAQRPACRELHDLLIGREIQREFEAFGRASRRRGPGSRARVVGNAVELGVIRHDARKCAGGVGDVVLVRGGELRDALAQDIQARSRARRQLAAREPRVANQVPHDRAPFGREGAKAVRFGDGAIAIEQRGVLPEARQGRRHPSRARTVCGSQGRRIAYRHEMRDGAPRIFERFERETDRLNHIDPIRRGIFRARTQYRVIEINQKRIDGLTYMEIAN